MKFYLKTKQECDEIVKNCEAFYRADRVVEGQNVAIYDYRLASLGDYVDNEAFELRGLCFVQLDDGTWERHLLLQKFFNINQTIGWMYDDVKDKKIVRVQNKEDGSIISFVKFGGIGGPIRAKSKMSFDSDQAVMAQELYDTNPKLQAFIQDCLRADLTPIFELVGYGNQIVLSYEMEKDLILLQMRLIDGNYMPQEAVSKFSSGYDIAMAKDYSPFHTLDQLLDQKATNQEDIEGWIVTFEYGQMAKIKTDKYIQLHGLIGPDAFRENLLIQTIIDGNIDDVIAQLVPGAKRDSILEMEKIVTERFNRLVKDFIYLRGVYFNVFQEDRKEFALKYSGGGKTPHPLFGSVMKTLNSSFRDVEKTAEDCVKEYISKATNSLGKAKEWIEGL